jgi:glutamine synthetase
MHSQDRIRQAARAGDVQRALANRGVVALAGTWVDNSGVTRVKAVPLGRLESAAVWGIGASPVFDAFWPTTGSWPDDTPADR